MASLSYHFLPDDDEEAARLLRQHGTTASQSLDKRLLDDAYKGGFTIHDHYGDAPTTGFMVSVSKSNEQVFSRQSITADDIAKYRADHVDLLRDRDTYIGAWLHKGAVYLDVSKHVDTEAQALALARQYDQLGVFNLSSGETIEVTGRLAYVDPGAHDNSAVYLTGNPPSGSDLVREFALKPADADFFAGELDDISRSYRDMPIIDPNVASLWVELGQLCVMQAAMLNQTWTIIRHDDIDPYANAVEMHADIAQRRYQVTSLHSDHPVWDPDTNVCFVEGTLVRARDGYRPIEQIRVGDEVLSADGTWNRVYSTMERDYDGELIDLETSGSFSRISVTPEHPFWVVQGNHRADKKSACTPYICDREYKNNGTRVNVAKSHVLGWSKAGDLTKGTWFPLTVDREVSDLIALDVPAQHWGQLMACDECRGRSSYVACTHKSLPRARGPLKFDLSPEFLWVLGFYIAEGCPAGWDGRAKGSVTSISFALHEDEVEYRNRLIAFADQHGYGYASELSGEHGWVVRINSSILGRWFPTIMGSGANNKKIPEELLRLPAEKLGFLLQGIFDGDGRKRDGTIDQTSKVLALQMVEAASRLGYQPTTGVYDDDDPNHHEVYRIHELVSSRHESRQKKYTWKLLNEDCRQIKSVGRRSFSGKVYNLSVENHETYVVEGIPVHNCFRVVHDVLGHGTAGSDFSFKGEVEAYQAQCAITPPHLWPALFTEIIAQSAYANVHHLFGEQKVGLLPLTQAEIDAHIGRIMDEPDPVYDPLHRSAFKTAHESVDYPVLGIINGGLSHAGDPKTIDAQGWAQALCRKSLWISVDHASGSGPTRPIRALADGMEFADDDYTQTGQAPDCLKCRAILSRRLAVRTAGQNGPLPSLRFEERRSPSWSADDVVAGLSAYVGSELVAQISWAPDGKINWVGVEDKWQRRGIATALFNEAKKIQPNLHHDVNGLNENSMPWSEKVSVKTAMPGRVLDRFPLVSPAGGLSAPREVIIARPAQDDLDDLDADERKIADAVIAQLRAGRAPLEAKQRPPLVGTYTVDIRDDGRDTGWRLGCYVTIGNAWVVYWVGPHGGYQDAERRMRAASKTASRANSIYGSGTIDSLFPGDALMTPVPWGQASRRKDGPLYDRSVVNQAVRDAQGRTDAMTEFDPRELLGTQPSLTRTGVAYYLGDDYEGSGVTYADQGQAGNRNPVVYVKNDGAKLILSGHHRAAAALIKGEPFSAIAVREPTYGAYRATTALFGDSEADRSIPSRDGRGGRRWNPFRRDRVAASGGLGSSGEDAATAGSVGGDRGGPTALRAHRTSALPGVGDWLPTRGMFHVGQPTLDPRIFDLNTEQMRADVRTYILSALDAYLRPLYGDWTQWTRVFLCGSGASYWWDSDFDCDILLGLDVDKLVAARPQNAGIPEQSICDALNLGLKEIFDPLQAKAMFAPDSGPWELTAFYNSGALDIRSIRPYSAYSIDTNSWIVHPPILPSDWGPQYFDSELWRRCGEMAIEVESVLNMSEPDRTAAAIKLFSWLHTWRHLAYTEAGQGWLDIGNILWQYLSQHPDRLLERLYLLVHPAGDAYTDAGIIPVTAADDHSTGIMVALVPPKALSAKLLDAMPEGADAVPLEEQHLTLAYLGKVTDYSPEQEDAALRAIQAASPPTLSGKPNGFGTFSNPGENVLVALWDIPFLSSYRTIIVTNLEAHGLTVSNTHGFTPHETMFYADDPITTLPELPRGLDAVEFDSVWLVWGSKWTEIPLNQEAVR